MRIVRVQAIGFGPLRDRELAFHPALTVVVGANESAKTSWHAATYAARCGIRRGRGQPLQRDRDFRDRFTPWDGGPWRVAADLVLDDGRTIQISQELEDRVDCRALELPRGRDVSGEITNEGVVDASVWLGLGRRAFEATACIRQADLLGVLGATDDLSEPLARLTDTGGTDETAATALTLLAEFSRTAVGTDRANAVGPLRRARQAVAAAQEEVLAARAARGEFDERAQGLADLRDQADRADRDVELVRAARDRAEAVGLARRVQEATALTESTAVLTAATVADPWPGDATDPIPVGVAAPPRARSRWPWLLVALGGLVAVVGLIARSPLGVGAGVVLALGGAVAFGLARPRPVGRPPARSDGVPDAGTAVAVEAFDERLAAQRRLGALLGDGDLADLEHAARLAQEAAQRSAASFTPAQLDALGPDAGLPAIRADREEAALLLQRRVQSAEGALLEAARVLPDVAGAEERLAAAQAELERVECLQSVLDDTIGFMSRAQERVHRDIAPLLRETLVRRLPAVTAGRYTDVAVDPQTLAVRVRGASGQWRAARMLSFGTAEQIHLLLRLALVELLTADHDTCPLLLDDVTVHADDERTRAILEVLREASATRQVVLFTQEESVARWARGHLGDLTHPAGAVIDLPRLPPP
ncbi:MAG: AAA family ATPase [Microthrixaceae bacterium]|nr:AAA family ATPase [Microthrixaceae bacterium]